MSSSVAARSRVGESSQRRTSFIPWLLAAGVLGGLLWYSQRPQGDAEPAQQPVIAANTAEAEPKPDSPDRTAAEPSTFRTIDLDAEDEASGADTGADEDKSQARKQTELAAQHAASDPTPAPAQGSAEQGADDAEVSEGTQSADAQTGSSEESGAETEAEPGGETMQHEPAAETQALPPFDTAAAKRSLSASALQASSCRRGDDPTGTAEVIVTFAPSGRVTSANVTGSSYGGTATGGCIAATLRSAQVPAFSGDHVTVRKLVKVR